VARVRAGDERAFELVFDRYHRSLLAFCRRMLASDEEAEDALQHTFMAAYRALGSSERPILLKAWLFTIARNRCLSILRARREQVALDDGHAASDGLAADVDRRAELRGLLADLEQLPEEQRAALVLFELGDHSHDEIAEVLGVRRDKVKALVFQARESLAGWRRARETPCVEIREQLATARGAALKRAGLRRHVARCAGCAEFDTEVRRQRSAMAMLLPVVPTAGLKAAVLGAAGIGAGAGAGGGSLAGLGAAKGLAAKTMLCAAVAGSAGSAGYVAVHEVQMHDARGDVPATASRASHRAGAGAARAVAQAAPAGKPIVIAQAAAPVAAAAAAKSSQVASVHRARYGGRHHRHDGFGGDGPRRAGAWDGHARREGSQRRDGPDGAQRHGFGRDGGAQRSDSGQRERSAQRDGAVQRDGSVRGGESGRGGARQRDRSAARHSLGSGTAG
jgi:RNA polymerase sigma factor (sigma-70 family)